MWEVKVCTVYNVEQMKSIKVWPLGPTQCQAAAGISSANESRASYFLVYRREIIIQFSARTKHKQ